VSDTSINIVEAKIVLVKMRETAAAIPHNLTDPKQREERWYLQMNILAYQMAIDKHEGTYRSPF